MKVQFFCAKCGYPLQSNIGEGINNLISEHLEKRAGDVAVYIAPCDKCNDVESRVESIIREAYKTIELKGVV